MHANETNNTNQKNHLIYPELSYILTGISFDAHNTLGRYSREKQYGDFIENRLKELNIKYSREFVVSGDSNRIDFLIDDKIILEPKAKRILTKEDYYQTQRYLQQLDIKLGILLNFRNQYLKPVRVIKIDKCSY